MTEYPTGSQSNRPDRTGRTGQPGQLDQPSPPVRIAPSLLSADFMNLERDIRLIEQGQPEWLHVDVMDGHFVPNLTIGPPVVKAIKSITDLPLDVHLMVQNPSEQLDWFIEAGADLLTVHLEAAADSVERFRGSASSATITELRWPERVEALISRIKSAGRLAGLAINPGTPAELALGFLSSIDLVMVMGVHPGFGGQQFIPSALGKLKLVADAAAAQHSGLLIEADGGIDVNTAPLAAAAGANLLVAGSAIFAQPDPLAALAAIRAALDA